jgi:pimeloyl-ACP methyl ester carboxylesterase
MTMDFTRRGRGKPLVLVHGLGSSRRAWSLVSLRLAEGREVIAIDLPGHGETPAEPDSGTFAGLARSLEQWLSAEKLTEADLVGSSMGARLVLEMHRRGHAGSVVALDPGGFWKGWERQFVKTTLSASGKLLRSLRSALPALARNPASRSLLLAQLCARPWQLNGAFVAAELQSLANTATFDSLVDDLAFGPTQEGVTGSSSATVTIGWGRHDRLCLPVQAHRAHDRFPGSRLVWFERSGHFPMWEEPEATIAVIRDSVGLSNSSP